jgi:hypothetical protein
MWATVAFSHFSSMSRAGENCLVRGVTQPARYRAARLMRRQAGVTAQIRSVARESH